MKIQMRDGKIVDEPLNKAQRLINKGDAHPVKEGIAQGGIVPQNSIPIIPLYNDQVLNKTQMEKLKEFKEKVIEVDVIEPIPMDHFVDFDKPKEVKAIKKVKKNK